MANLKFIILKIILVSGIIVINGQSLAKIPAKQLELQPYLARTFEQDCSLSHAKLMTVLTPYIIKKNYTEVPAYSLTTYWLKNVTYRGIGIKYYTTGYGNIGRQTNESLVFDIATPSSKKKFQQIAFATHQPQQGTGLSIKRNKNTAEVQCYVVDEMFLVKN